MQEHAPCQYLSNDGTIVTVSKVVEFGDLLRLRNTRNVALASVRTPFLCVAMFSDWGGSINYGKTLVTLLLGTRPPMKDITTLAFFDYSARKWARLADLRHFLPSTEVLYIVFAPAQGYLKVKLGFHTVPACDNLNTYGFNMIDDKDKLLTSLRLYLKTKLEIHDVKGAGFFYSLLKDQPQFTSATAAEASLKTCLLYSISSRGRRTDCKDNLDTFSTALEYYRFYDRAHGLRDVWASFAQAGALQPLKVVAPGPREYRVHTFNLDNDNTVEPTTCPTTNQESNVSRGMKRSRT